MEFGKTKGSQALAASWLCAAALSCAPDPVQQGPGYQPGLPQPVQDGGVILTGDTGVGPGPTPDGGGALPDTGVMVVPVRPADAGPVDLGMNSQGDMFFRADTLVLKQPQLRLDLPIPFTTATFPTPITEDVQKIVSEALVNDGDKNGRVDLSLLIRFFQTANPSAANGQTTIGGGQCPLPVARESACGSEPLFPFQSPAVAYSNGQNCALEETTEVAAGACFGSARTSLAINVPLLGPIPLQDGQVIGTWQDGGIAGGRVRGFLPKAVAMATKLPMDIPQDYVDLGVKPGGPLTNHLNDSELAKNSRGEDGWWFLLSFTAKPATFNPALPAL